VSAVRETERSCSWIARIPASPYQLNPYVAWADALGSASDVDEERSGVPDATARRGAATAHDLLGGGADAGERLAPARGAHVLARPGAPHARRRGNTPAGSLAQGRPRAEAVPPAGASAHAILSRFGGRAAVSSRPRFTLVEPGRGRRRAPDHSVEWSQEWRDRLARATADRLSEGDARWLTPDPGVDGSGLRAALAAILDAPIEGSTITSSTLDAIVNRQRQVPAAPVPRAATSAIAPPEDVAGAGMPVTQDRGDEAASQPGGVKNRIGASSTERPLIPHGPPPFGHPEAAPLQPAGLSSSASAPAPDVSLSVPLASTRSLNRIAPPLATPALPPLLPDVITQPPAWGLSGAAMRSATLPEDAALAGEDLSELAEKVRRILQEDAVRHGVLPR
jgi:hypothetical protein